MYSEPNTRCATTRSSLPTRRDVVRALAAATVGGPAVLRSRFSLFAHEPTQYSARAIRLVEEATVLDLLNQFRFADFSEDPPRSRLWLSVPATFTVDEYEPYRTSGINVFALGHGAGSYDDAVKYFAEWNSFITGYNEWFMRVDDGGDFERVRSSGKVGILLTIQDSTHFRRPDDVNFFYAVGQRVSQLTYNFANR